MIPKDQLRDLAAKLLAKTRAKEVNWVYHTQDDYGCELHLPHSTVELTFDSPPAEPDRVQLTLNRWDEGDEPSPVAELTVEEGEPDWELFRNLYDEASRVVYKWDQVLNELTAAVNEPGPIGESR